MRIVTIMRRWLVIAWAATATAAVAQPQNPLPGHRTYGAWHSAAIGGGGYLQQVHFSPSSPQRIYLTSDVGGFYRSDDAGRTWRMLHGNLPDNAGGSYCRGLWPDPDDADRFLVAVDHGIYLTTDGGMTFERTLKESFHGNSPSRNHGFILVSSPRDPNVLLAAADRQGVYRSTDRGLTWAHHGPTNLWYPSAVVFDPHHPERVWLCVNGWKDGSNRELGLWRSDDEGQTWTKLSEQSPSEFVQDPQAPGTFYGLIKQRPVRSMDEALTWEPFDAGLPSAGKGARDDGLYASIVAHENTIALGGHGGHCYLLDRDAAAWTLIPRGTVDEGDWWGRMRPDIHQHFGSALGFLAINPHNPDQWFFTDWYAIYQSPDAGRSWTLCLDGIELTVLHGVTQDPHQPRTVHIGMADLGYFRSEDALDSIQWVRKDISNNIRPLSASLAQAGRLYAVGPAQWHWYANQVFISDDAGRTWRRSEMTGLPELSQRRTNTIAADAARPQTVYVTVSGSVGRDQGGVYRSGDGGRSWTWIGHGLPDGESLFRENIWAHGPELASSADGSMVAISIDRNRAFRYDPDSAQWTGVPSAMGGAAFAVFADPHHAGRYYLCRKEGGLWRSDNGGRSWTRLLQRPAHWLAVDHAAPGWLALVSETDVLLSLDDGKQWSQLDRSLPYRHMRNQVAFAGDRLVVGTGGNGVFWMHVADAPRPTIAAAATPPIGLGAGSPSPLRNGGMEEGDQTPSHWDLSSYREGKIALARDTTVARTGRASLKLQTEGKAASFAHQMLTPRPDGPFVVSGFARTQGQFERVQVAVQVFDAKWRQIDWKTVADVKGAAGQWIGFEQRLQLPKEGAYALLGLSVSGDGAAWLDDVSVTVVPATQEAGRGGATNASAAEPLPQVVPANDARLQYGGRMDRRDPKAPRATWSHTGVRVRFEGRALNALVTGGQHQIVIDGTDAGILHTREGVQRYRIAEGLGPGEHTVELWKRTEPCFGIVSFHGIELEADARLLESAPRPRSIELIGDSIATGHGNEGTNPRDPFGPDTQNAWLAYGAIAARMLDADYTCIGWSGRKMWPNDTIGELYDFAIPQEQRRWDFSSGQPSVVVIALGANDFRNGPPERAGWTAAYVQFVGRVRSRYPEARIVVASAPTLAGGWRTTLIEYLQQVVTTCHEAGDKAVSLMTFSEPPGQEGVGANYHPSLRTHRRLAGELAAALATQMGWSAKPIDEVLQRYEATAASADLPQRIEPSDARLRYVGRFLRNDAGAMTCAWPHSSLSFQVRASAVQARIGDSGNNRVQVFIDGKPRPAIALRAGTHVYTLADNLPADRTHRIEIIRITEALFGDTTFAGLCLPQDGALLQPHVRPRAIEIIGDSISAGYGNEAPDQTHKFESATQNAAMAYGGLVARALDADLHVIAWSGKLLWPNNTMTELYSRVLPQRAEPMWDAAAAGWSPQVIVINLGTNDFAGGNPQRDGWTQACIDFVRSVRSGHPQAMIYLAVGPMLSDEHSPSGSALTTIKRYLADAIDQLRAGGDDRVRLLTFATQHGDNGFGAGWHPSIRTHQIMAEHLTQTLQQDMDWTTNAFRVDTDFPGGNAVIESVEADEIRLRPDLRDTEGNWFYWSVRVRGAAGRTLRFRFTAQDPLADRGPAMSSDGGITWRWLGREDGRRDRFTLTVPEDANEVILSYGMNYTRRDWDRFIASLPSAAAVDLATLATTRKGRDVPLLRLGRLDGQAAHRLLLTARTHACEMMANYVIEGFLAAAVADDEVGRWFASQVELAAVPFMDVDGVEEGDQGKNRRPRDHNRDYAPPHAHVETAALVAWARTFFDGRPVTAIDLHCPWIHGGYNEQVFQPGAEDPARWDQQQRFATLVSRIRQGPISYGPDLDLPFGQDWNTGANYHQGLSTSRWAATQPGIVLATTMEIPYATASGVEVNPASLRALGRDLAHALKLHLAADEAVSPSQARPARQ